MAGHSAIESCIASGHKGAWYIRVPRRDKLAHVAHICSFLQVLEVPPSLLLMPGDMPLAQARPRLHRSHLPGAALSKIDMQRLRLACAWLKQHNPYYYNVEWRGDTAAVWEADVLKVASRLRPVTLTTRLYQSAVGASSDSSERQCNLVFEGCSLALLGWRSFSAAKLSGPPGPSSGARGGSRRWDCRVQRSAFMATK